MGDSTMSYEVMTHLQAIDARLDALAAAGGGPAARGGNGGEGENGGDEEPTEPTEARPTRSARRS